MYPVQAHIVQQGQAVHLFPFRIVETPAEWTVMPEFTNSNIVGTRFRKGGFEFNKGFAGRTLATEGNASRQRWMARDKGVLGR